MAQAKRKHVATGAPRGGARAGAGRPEGSTLALGYGEIRALEAAKLRVPEDASPEVKALADRTYARLVHVMEEKVSPFQAGHVLKAATRLREEACGPLAQKVEVSGRLEHMTDEQLEARLRALTAQAKPAETEPEP